MMKLEKRVSYKISKNVPLEYKKKFLEGTEVDKSVLKYFDKRSSIIYNIKYTVSPSYRYEVDEFRALLKSMYDELMNTGNEELATKALLDISKKYGIEELNIRKIKKAPSRIISGTLFALTLVGLIYGGYYTGTHSAKTITETKTIEIVKTDQKLEKEYKKLKSEMEDLKEDLFGKEVIIEQLNRDKYILQHKLSKLQEELKTTQEEYKKTAETLEKIKNSSDRKVSQCQNLYQRKLEECEIALKGYARGLNSKQNK